MGGSDKIKSFHSSVVCTYLCLSTLWAILFWLVQYTLLTLVLVLLPSPIVLVDVAIHDDWFKQELCKAFKLIILSSDLSLN